MKETEMAIAMLPQWMQDLGTIASILSLLASGFIILKTWRIARHYQQLAIIPKTKRQLRIHLKNMDTHIRNKNLTEIRKVVASVTSVVTHLESITFGVTRQSARKTLIEANTIILIDESAFTIADVDRLYLMLIELETDIGQFIDQKKWE